MTERLTCRVGYEISPQLQRNNNFVWCFTKENQQVKTTCWQPWLTPIFWKLFLFRGRPKMSAFNKNNPLPWPLKRKKYRLLRRTSAFLNLYRIKKFRARHQVREKTKKRNTTRRAVIANTAWCDGMKTVTSWLFHIFWSVFVSFRESSIINFFINERMTVSGVAQQVAMARSQDSKIGCG